MRMNKQTTNVVALCAVFGLIETTGFGNFLTNVWHMTINYFK